MLSAATEVDITAPTVAATIIALFKIFMPVPFICVEDICNCGKADV